MSNDTIKKMKAHSKELEKIFSNHISDKGLLFRIHKNSLTINNKKATQLKSKEFD